MKSEEKKKELEKKVEEDKEPRWDTAIEFPEIIPSMGRSKLHEIANYFGLAHHSIGAKGKHRRVVMYPKTLYTEKQERERVRLEKERDQLYEKFSTVESFVGMPPVNPLTFREQVMKEIWETKFSKDKKDNASK